MRIPDCLLGRDGQAQRPMILPMSPGVYIAGRWESEMWWVFACLQPA